MRGQPVLQVFGGGRLQKKLIKQAEDQGIAVVVIDRDPSAPGKLAGSYKFEVSISDYEENLRIARDLKVNGILTLSTDIAVPIVAKIAHELNLPSFISPDTALLVTNKDLMKSTLLDNNIPSAKFIIIKHSEEQEVIDRKIHSLKFPVVIKPVDSQGQRGVFLIYDQAHLYENIKEASKYSRVGDVIIEEYIEGYEVVASVWVSRGELNLLILTDRVILFDPPTLGICLAHIFPSKYGEPYLDKIKELLKQIISAFKIHEGPIYGSFLISNSGVYIVEFACRLGGGHEEDLIPAATGVDVRQGLIDFSLGRRYDFNKYDFNYDLVRDSYGVFFIAAKGRDKVLNCIPLENQISNEDLLWGEFYIKNGSVVNHLTNATDRIGAFLIRGKNRDMLWSNAQSIYNKLTITGNTYKNLISDIFSLPLKNI